MAPASFVVRRIERCATADGFVKIMAATVLTFSIIGCNGLPKSTPGEQADVQTYMAPPVAGGTPVAGAGTVSAVLSGFTISDTEKTFSQTDTNYLQGINSPDQYAGTFTTLPRGLLDLSVTYSFTAGSPVQGGYAIELAGQGGALLQLQGESVTPLAATSSCPSFGSAQTFQFITIPLPNAPGSTISWNPATDTAFGSAKISTSGTTVNFSTIQQFTLPVNGAAPGVPITPFVASATGLCTSDFFGNTVSTPANVTVTNPGSGQSVIPSTTLGIGPTGFLIASNSATLAPPFDNLLGAGSGAVGVPQPANALGASPVSAQGQQAPQYLGFIYNVGGSSEPISLGFSSLPSTCPSVTPTTSTLVYGGDFQNGNPASSPDGYGLCNFALDLGPESPTSNGLYLAAKVWSGVGFGGAATTTSNPAVAVVGQLQGKFVILVITQSSSIYLFQSN